MGAAAFDISAVSATLGEIPIQDIGMIMLGLAAFAVGFKWAKAAIFG